MSTALATQVTDAAELALVTGDLSRLTPEQRLSYYNRVCESIDVNPLTRPFDYITLNGKLLLYAKKDCTDQLRTKRKISIRVVSRETVDGVLTVTVRATTPDGREDEDVGAVPIANLKGEQLSNAHMKALTKAKRRVTLSICGLGFTDESEIDSIPGARVGEPEPPPQARIVAPPPVDEAAIKAAVESWSARFDAATDSKALDAMRKACKTEVHDPGALLEISKSFAAAQKRLSGQVNGAPANG